MAFSIATDLQNHNPPARIVRRPDEIRHRALARLYERRCAVENLIGALERYQQGQNGLTVKCAPPTAGEMSS
jgi:hypothetical protein